MLKRFTVENFLSFQKEIILDLTAGTTKVNSEHLVDFGKARILKSAVMYGANASGKSNMVKAIEYGKEIILKGLDNVETYKKHFRLDNNSSKKPTIFEFELEFNGKFFSYGFSSILNTKQVFEEWLYEIREDTSEKIFARENNTISLGNLLIEEKIRDRFEIYKSDMKNQDSQLFLSEIAIKNLDINEVKLINIIYNWFDEKLLILYPDTQFGGKSLINQNKNLSKLFKKYLNEFDTGIISINSIEEDFDKSLKDIPKKVKKNMEKSLKPQGAILIKTSNGILTVCKNNTGELKVQKLGLIHSKVIEEVFELEEESDGTIRLFDLIPLIDKFSQDNAIIIDEFDRSLHPKLTQKFFELFYKSNNSKAQLIVTTHESTLLDLNLMRRDEIWFVEKDKNGGSKIFSLNQFKSIYDSKLEKAYLLGRYGALPVFKFFDEINGDN